MHLQIMNQRPHFIKGQRLNPRRLGLLASFGSFLEIRSSLGRFPVLSHQSLLMGGQGLLAIKRLRDQRSGPHEYPDVAKPYMIAKLHQAGRLTSEPLLDRNQF